MREAENGRAKIIKVLKIYRELSLTEIAKKTELAKSTVSHHLKNLENEKLVKKTEDGLYRLVETSVEREILEAVRELTLNEAKFVDLQQVTEKVKEKISVDQSEVNDIANRLSKKGLVEKIGSKVKLTKDGAEYLGVCVACLKQFGDGDQVLTIASEDAFGYPLTYRIHLKCLKNVIGLPWDCDRVLSHQKLFCDFCGLPLNRELFLELCIPRVTVQDVEDVLTPDELSVLKRDEKGIVLADYEDVRLFLTGLYLRMEYENLDGTLTLNGTEGNRLRKIARNLGVPYDRAKVRFEREDVTKRAAEVYRRVLELRREYLERANEAFDRLLDPLGRACGMVNVWWHRELADPYKNVTRQDLVIHRGGKFYHPYCYELVQSADKQ